MQPHDNVAENSETNNSDQYEKYHTKSSTQQDMLISSDKNMLYKPVSSKSQMNSDAASSRVKIRSNSNTEKGHATDSPFDYDDLESYDDAELADMDRPIKLLVHNDRNRVVKDGRIVPHHHHHALIGDSDTQDEKQQGLLYTHDASELLNPTRRLPLRKLVALSAFWWGWSALWMPLLTVLLPFQIQELVGAAQKGTALGNVLLLGSVVSIIAGPFVGSYSDSCRSRSGRRRPFMIFGGIIVSVALLMMTLSPNLRIFEISFIVLGVGNNFIIAPYSALVPDIVPIEQRGQASGWLSFMSLVGFLCGGVLSYYVDELGIGKVYMIVMVLHDISLAVTCAYVEELTLPVIGPIDAPDKIVERFASIVKPFTDFDFRWVFFSRFLMQLGIMTVQEYLSFYLTDAIGVGNFVVNGKQVAESASEAVSILFIPVLVGSIFSSIGSGILSDCLGGKRKFLVYAAGSAICFSAVLFALTRSFSLDLWLSFIFGIGYGTYSALDWAIAQDVLPAPAMRGKDMGLWGLALILPQVLAAPIAGHILDFFASSQVDTRSYHVGYTVIFLIAVLYCGAGTYFTKKLQGVH